jgi:hypothetical protein
MRQIEAARSMATPRRSHSDLLRLKRSLQRAFGSRPTLLESQTLIDEILRLTRFWGARGSGDRAETVEKKAETDAELEEMILQRLVIGGVFVSVQPDASLGWRPTVNRTS